MSINLHMIGAGEFRSFREDIQETSYFIRFLRSDGEVFDLPVTEEQLGAVLSFTAASEAPAPEPMEEVRDSAPRVDDAPPPLVLRRPHSAPPHVFASFDDERDL